MVESFWILQIETPQFTSGGVVMFINGKVFGGDSGFTWVGSYQADERLIKARVRVHNFDPKVQNILGVSGNDYEMHLSGNVRGDTITGTAIVANQPQYSLGIRLIKHANL